MKKFLIFAVMMMVACGAKAQLRVDSVGKVRIGALTTSNNKLTISGNQNGIHCETTPSATSSSSVNIAIKGYSNHLGYERSTGVFGSVSGSSGYGTVYGVRGEAFGGGNGKNYGVFGHIISVENGAGIYGTTHTSCIGETLDGCYAGYFEGNVKITGSLSGVLLGGATSSLLRSNMTILSERNDKEVTPLIRGIEPSVYLLNYPQRESTEKIEDKDFDSNSEEYNMSERQIMSKRHYGLDADQLEEVFPDLVYENEDGTKSINYVEMVPILVQAINELSAKVEELEGGSAAKKAVTRSSANADEMGENVVMLSLGQNKPNPFGTTTSIEVSIPNDVQKAFIYVYDLQGKKVDQVVIAARGTQTIQLNSANLSDGMYLYSLIADGKVVETRRMIVEK